MSEWSHLANAKHIDLIIAHVKANYETWDVAFEYAGPEAVRPARNAAYEAVYDAAGREAAWAAVRRGGAVAWNSADDAVLALVAWDHAGGLMDLPAEQVKVLAILGDQAAIMMYTAIAAMETTQELV